MLVILNLDIEITNLNQEKVIIEEGTVVYLDSKNQIAFHYNTGIHFELERGEYSCIV